MLHLIKEYYRNPEEDKINYPIINREYDKDISEYIISCFQSISSVLDEIQLVDSRFIIDVDKVNQSSYERTRSNKAKDQSKQYCYIQESRLGELILTFKVDFKFDDPKDGLYQEDKYYKIKLLIPIPDEKGYYLIKSKRYILQYQLTESSTYTTSSALITKSLLPVKMRRKNSTLQTIDGRELYVNFYEVMIFNKYQNFIYFYFATMGWQNTLEYFNVGQYIQTLEESDDKPGYAYIKVSSTVVLKIRERAFTNEYVQTILGNICDACNNRTNYVDLESKVYWTKRIGAFKLNSPKESHYEFGRIYIIFFNRMLDNGTIDSLRLTDYNKRDIFAVIRWMAQNFNELYEKDNLNIINKRLRCNEYVSSLLNDIISERIKKFVNTTANTKDKLETKYNNFFAYRGNEIVSKLHSSGLLRYDDVVNDMDLFQRTKVTSKGPSSGNKADSKTVSAKRRGLDPSHLGRLDINFCSSSDPGLTNYLTLGCRTDGMYFDGAPAEPESFYYNLKKEMGELPEENVDEEGNQVLILDPVKYNLVIDAISGFKVHYRYTQEHVDEMLEAEERAKHD